MHATYKYKKCGVSSDTCDYRHDRARKQARQGSVKTSRVQFYHVLLGPAWASHIRRVLRSGGYQKSNAHCPLTIIISNNTMPSHLHGSLHHLQTAIITPPSSRASRASNIQKYTLNIRNFIAIFQILKSRHLRFQQQTPLSCYYTYSARRPLGPHDSHMSHTTHIRATRLTC